MDRQQKRRYYWLGKMPWLAMVFLVLIVAGLLVGQWLQISYCSVTLKRLPARMDGLRIVHMSDFHSACFGEDNLKLVEAVKGQSPDLIVITGDLVDRMPRDEEKAVYLVSRLRKLAPVFFVTGNHEYYSSHVPELTAALEKIGVTVLHNQAVSFEHQGAKINIAGVADPFTGHDDLVKALEETDEGCTLLLSHSPEIFEEAVVAQVDMLLAGHYHAGQIRFPPLPALYAPGAGLLPEYDYGLYRQDSTYMYLTRGLGATGLLRFRFFNRPEVAVITCRAVQ
ncbi:metallophosphoesterase [Syntrophomonas erecta]